MSAKDDAPKTPARISYRLTTLAFALVAGAAMGLGIAVVGAPSTQPFFEVRMPWTGDAPHAPEWPGPVRAGESARLETGHNGLVLAVRSSRAPRARELAAQLRESRESGKVALGEAADQVTAAWVARLRPGALLPLSPGAECAAWLTASARFSRDLARALPAPWAAPSGEVRAAAPVALLERLQEVDLAAAATDSSALRLALLAAERASAEWFTAGVPAPDASPLARGAMWRQWHLEHADSLDAHAAALLVGQTPLQIELSGEAAALHVMELAREFPEPYAPLMRAASAAEAPPAAPLPGEWGRWLGFGAGLGAWVTGLAAALGLLLRRRVGGSSLLFLPAREPSDPSAWLHVVAGPNSTAIARAVLELAAHALGRGQRVLVVDGGSRLKLHERFGREARWGLMECLLADMPVLGLVQYGGRPGFYLLAHGNATRGEGWATLGQRLDDVRPHFGRIILALDSQAPRAIGDALAGRALEGWWADAAGHYPKVAGEMSGRLGIAFSSLDLSVMPEVSLELLSGRVRALSPVSPIPVESPEIIQAVPALSPLAVIPVPEPEPVVLDCDLQVLQRLRFLAWMRRVQSESRTVEAASAR